MLRHALRHLFVNRPRNFVEIPIGQKGRLYVSPMPFGRYDTFNEILDLYKRHRIHKVIVLVTDEEIEKKARKNPLTQYRRLGIETIRFPFKDFLSPVYARFAEVMPEILESLESERVCIHCNAGVGRTGLVTSCIIALLENMDGREAMTYVKSHMMTDLTEGQQRFVVQWVDEYAPALRLTVERRDRSLLSF